MLLLMFNLKLCYVWFSEKKNKKNKNIVVLTALVCFASKQTIVIRLESKHYILVHLVTYYKKTGTSELGSVKIS